MNVDKLRRFCNYLRRELAIEEECPELSLKYEKLGEPAAATWDERGEIGTFTDEYFFGETKWDHEREKAVWPQLWPEELYQNRVVERARIQCGNIPRESTEELMVQSYDGLSTAYPREVIVSLRPVVPSPLDDDGEDNRCFGSLSVSFYGGGYFTWQPLAKYWQAVRASPFLARALAVCRAGLPGMAIENVEGIKAELGDLFLNRAEHQPGDWIVSVEESD